MNTTSIKPGEALVRPRALRPGATLAIVSPASTPREERVLAGIAALEAAGYRTKLFPHALTRGPLYYAGTAEQRASDLHAAFADPEVEGILCTRGGWGTAEILPLLDASLVRANPKPFLGYSDHTSLQLWLRSHAGLISFYAPMCAADWSKPDGVDRATWEAALGGSAHWTVGAEAGLRVLRPGIANGELTGGCMALMAESLGTAYAAQPVRTGSVLFLEDIHVKPYQWDRMLVHLRYAGLLEGVRGIVFGDMGQCVPAEELPALKSSLLHALQHFAGPIAIGLRSGHVDRDNLTLPLGVQVRLELDDVENPRMHFLERAVAL